MKPVFLDFEQPIAELTKKIDELRFVQGESAVDISDEITRLQKKSADLILQRKQDSQFLMVSHSVSEIKKFCDMVLFLSPTGVQLYDDVDEAIERYKQQC